MASEGIGALASDCDEDGGTLSGRTGGVLENGRVRAVAATCACFGTGGGCDKAAGAGANAKWASCICN